LQLDQPPIEALVVALGVVVGDVFSDGCAEVVLAQQHELVEAFALDGTHKAFGVGVEIGTARRQADRRDPAERRSSRKAVVYGGSRSMRR
jgi:hypothetical protein